MSYNVLNYGAYPLCDPSVSNGKLHSYLSAIVQFANPDIIGLVKTGSIQCPGANSWNAPIGFADSILDFAMNTAYPARYAYCPLSNISSANTMSVLFYNKQKLGYIALTSDYANTTDFLTYKLYYKDPNLATTLDTTFLYITLGHDQSGTTAQSLTLRHQQIAGEMQQIQSHFTHLPNMINMGDFNVRSSLDSAYITLISPTDTDFRFFDPPFNDGIVTYPATWDNNPNPYASFLSTSTHAVVMNNCDVGGGAKDWYDHIFVSPWIAKNTNYITYIPHSFRAVGNDGNRIGVAVNSPANTSAPVNVINALLGMSDKYPVMLDLAVTYNTSGISPVDPEIPLGVSNTKLLGGNISIVNPVSEQLTIYVPNSLLGQKIIVDCYDELGRKMIDIDVFISKQKLQLPCSLHTGIYFIQLRSEGNNVLYKGAIVKQ